MSKVLSTRLFEMALPEFSGLNLAEIEQAGKTLEAGDAEGFNLFIQSFSKAATLHTIRKISALWNATEIELRTAEVDPKVMQELVDRQSEKPFSETFRDTTDFLKALFASFALAQNSSGLEVKAPKKTQAPKKVQPESIPSGD
jgi:hypothetical protein